MNTTGYAVLTQDQLDLLYGPSSPYNDSEAHSRLSNISASQVDVILDQTVRAMAREELAFKVRNLDTI